jgi:hypothetical protein
VHFSMSRPLRNRFVHLDLEPDFEDWSKWAVKAGIRPEIIAFLRFKPTLLLDSDATPERGRTVRENLGTVRPDLMALIIFAIDDDY